MTEIAWYNRLPKHLLPDIPNPHFKKHLVSLPARVILVGASGSGKTQLVLSALHNMPDTFTHVVLCCANASEPLYQYMKLKLPEEQFTVCEGIENIPDLEDLSRGKGDHTLVIMDDLCNEKNQRKICEYALRCRKIPASMIYCTQSFYATPKMVRVNASHVWLKKLSTVRDLRMILSDFDLDVGKDTMMKMYSQAVEDGSFLNIAVTDPPDIRFRKGFSEVIPYTNESVVKTEVGGAGVGHFVEAIERKYNDIQQDYQSNKKTGHWSWFLFPLLREANQTPSAGTAKYYLENDTEIEEYLEDPEVQRYYVEALTHLSHLVTQGKKLRRPMDPEQSLKAWLGGEDYLKVLKHIEQFKPLATRLGKKVVLSLYKKILPKLKPSSRPIPPDAFEKEFG